MPSNGRSEWDWILGPSRVLSVGAPSRTRTTPWRASLCCPTLRPSTVTASASLSYNLQAKARGAPSVPSNPESLSSPSDQTPQPALLASSVQVVVAALAADPTFTAAIATMVSASLPRPQVDGVGPSGYETLGHDDCPPDTDLSFLE
ncbi:hypothetical protein MTO96_038154 [Rhipicephalus appendiculatus]